MAILVDEKTKMIIQGITGRQGTAVSRYMIEYGSMLVGGVTPGRGGSSVWGVPVYETVDEAQREQGPIDASITYVPGPQVKDAVVEAIDAGIKLIFMTVERVPLHDMLFLVSYSRRKETRIVGPGMGGIVSAGKAVAGMLGGSAEMARQVFKPGHVGVVSRSGGQTTTVSYAISSSGLGITTAVHIGSEPIVGTTFSELLPLFERDEQTSAIAMFGEIGTVAEEEAAQTIQGGVFTKPIVAYVAGRALPQGIRYSHASAIVEHGRGTAESKVKALKEAGAEVVEKPGEIAPALAAILRK
jgi:succinyl-CoA synthetase alpha subunit